MNGVTKLSVDIDTPEVDRVVEAQVAVQGVNGSHVGFIQTQSIGDHRFKVLLPLQPAPQMILAKTDTLLVNVRTRLRDLTPYPRTLAIACLFQ